MEVQSDYETEVTLAVFRTADALEAALQRLRAGRVEFEAMRRLELGPGHYALADTSMAEQVGGALRGVGIGVPAGAAIGVVVAAAALAGASPEVMAGMAGAGALAGGFLGAYGGAILRTRFDDDVAVMHHVIESDPHVVLVLYTSGANRATANARRLLAEAGAIAFLDTSLFAQLDRDWP
jgi:hypothetical protein